MKSKQKFTTHTKQHVKQIFSMASLSTDWTPTLTAQLVTPLSSMQDIHMQSLMHGRMERTNNEMTSESHSKLDVAIALDGSGSCVNEYPLAQNFAKDFVRKLFSMTEQEEKTEQLADDKLRMSVVQYGTEVTIQQGWSANVETIKAGIDIPHMNGSTNTAGALEACCKLHIEQGRHDARKLVVVVTDGKPDDQSSTQVQAEKLKAAGITVIIVTVGKLRKHTMSYLQGLVSLPSTEHLIAANSFNALPKVLPNLLGAANCGSVQMVPKPLRIPGSFRGETMITLELQNKTAADIERPFQVRVRGSKQYVESIFVPVPTMKQGQKVQVQVPHKFKSIPISKTNATVEYELYDGTRLIQRVVYELSVADFIGDLEPDFLPKSMYASVIDGINGKMIYQQVTFEKINILFYGWVGAGKSSNLNTVASLMDPLSGQVKHGLAKVVGGVSHATTKVQHYQIGTSPKICIIDSPGLEKGTYNTKELELILKGGIGDDTELVNKKQGESKEIDNYQLESAHHDLIHVVVIYMPIDLMSDENAMDMVKKQLDVCAKMDYNPIIMLCKVDETEPAMRANPLGFDEYEELVSAREELADTLGYPKARILYTVPYTDEQERTWDIDALAYKNMERWVGAAKVFMENRAAKGLREFKKQEVNKRRAEEYKRMMVQQDKARTKKEESDRAEAEEEAKLQLAKDTSLAEERQKEEEKVTAARNKEPIETWLKIHGLGAYADNFIEDGCDNLGDFQEMTVEELNDLADEYGMSIFKKKKFLRVAQALISGESKNSGVSNAADPGGSPSRQQSSPAPPSTVTHGSFLSLFGFG